jgi:hypothetical protein
MSINSAARDARSARAAEAWPLGGRKESALADPLATTVSILTAIGVGGVIGAYFQARFQQHTQVGQLEHDLKQKRYLCILILMLTKLNPQVGLPKARPIRPDLKNVEDINSGLEAELLNGFVFASDAVLEALAAFIREPSHRSFAHAATSMRKDLWGKRTTVSEDILDVVSSIG